MNKKVVFMIHVETHQSQNLWQLYIFQMDSPCNVTSIDQLCFKLTEILLPSATRVTLLTPNTDSLAYTHSAVSLNHILCQNQDQNCQPPTPRKSYLCKKSTLKSTCADVPALTPLGRNGKISARQKAFSTNQVTARQAIKRGFSLHFMSLRNDFAEKRECGTPLHALHSEPFRAKQQRKRSTSGRQLSDINKMSELSEWQLLQLRNSLKVKGLVLQSHQARQKSFLRKVIQNRSKVVHAADQNSLSPQIWTSRYSFRLR